MTRKMISKRGFSFMEVIVVVAIITIMTMVMMVVAFKDRDKKKIESVGREVAAALRETQNNALTGKQGDDDGLPCAFAFMLVNGGKGYDVKGSHRAVDGECGEDNDEASYVKTFNKMTYTNGITITGYGDSSLNQNNFIVFSVPYGKYTDEQNPSLGTDFVIKKEHDDHKYHICVHATGLIEEIGFDDDDFACSF